MHASLARERDHRARADADVGQRAAVKTYEELGGFAPLRSRATIRRTRRMWRMSMGVLLGQDLRPCSPFTSERFPRLSPELSGLFRSFAEERRGRGPSATDQKRGGSQLPLSSERVSREQSAYYLCIPVIELERARGSRMGQRPLSTWTMKSPARRLNSSGSSRLMV